MRTRQQRTGQREQKNWAHEFWRRTAGKESRDRTAGEDSWDGTGRTRKRGQDGQNMTDEQGSWARTTEIV
jgi:hypothetical protein